MRIEGSQAGSALPVRVTPGADRSEVMGVRDGRLAIRVAAPARDGAANRELCRVLARTLGVGRSAVDLRSGERAREKTLYVEGIRPRELRRRLGL